MAQSIVNIRMDTELKKSMEEVNKISGLGLDVKLHYDYEEEGDTWQGLL